MNFREWLVLEAVPFNPEVVNRVRTGYKSSTRNITPPPGTFGVELEFHTTEGLEREKFGQYVQLLHRLGLPAVEGNTTPGQWSVGRDSQGVVEIASPILTIKDLPTLLHVMTELKKTEQASGRTSAHVHVGMSPDTDGFDLLAMTTLVDEKAVRHDSSDDRDFGSFAKLRGDSHNDLGIMLPDGIYQSDEIKKIIENRMDRNFGTNLKAYFKYNTVEFRYFSSQIEPEKLSQWIEYFLELPRIARSRNQIRMKPQGQWIIATRMPNGQVQISRDIHNAPQVARPVADLRQPFSDPISLSPRVKWLQRYAQLALKYHGRKTLKGLLHNILNLTAQEEVRVIESLMRNYRKNTNFGVYDLQPDEEKMPLKKAWPSLDYISREIIITRMVKLGMLGGNENLLSRTA